MLNYIINELNLEGIEDEDLLVSFDITNMFPSIDNHAVRCGKGPTLNLIDMHTKLMCRWNVFSKPWRFVLSVIVPLPVDSIGCRKTVRLWALKILVHMPTS